MANNNTTQWHAREEVMWPLLEFPIAVSFNHLEGMMNISLTSVMNMYLAQASNNQY